MLLKIFVLGHNLFLESHSKPHSGKNVHSSEQIMSVGKHPSMFLHQMEAIVYILPKAKSRRIFTMILPEANTCFT